MDRTARSVSIHTYAQFQAFTIWTMSTIGNLFYIRPITVSKGHGFGIYCIFIDAIVVTCVLSVGHFRIPRLVTKETVPSIALFTVLFTEHRGIDLLTKRNIMNVKMSPFQEGILYVKFTPENIDAFIVTLGSPHRHI